MPKTSSIQSVDSFLIPVTVLIAEGANEDPTGDDVAFAFWPVGTPGGPLTTATIAGFWLNTGAKYLAGITYGPGTDVVLDVGEYTAWLYLVDNPTAPFVPVDTLTITSP
jgi:hypothetical protein